MSDFDTVLERLLSDPAFQAALADNPEQALAGYDLSADEAELLHAQVVTGSGTDRTVETRTSKSGMAGLLGPIAEALAAGPSGGQMLGSAPHHEALGSAPHHENLGEAPSGEEQLGSARAGTGGQSVGTAEPAEVVGAAEGGPAGAGTASVGHLPEQVPGYHPHVDVDGDGHWDRYEAYRASDGGVDVVADMNHDGRIDFVGHDANGDGLIDSAVYDDDFDGTADTRMFDDNGDGWLDRAEKINDSADQAIGRADGPS